MLFTSQEFLFSFLPIVVILYYIIRIFHAHRVSLAFLVGASLLYYAWWDIRFLPLLVFSVIFNYYCAKAIAFYCKRSLFFFGVLVNILLVFYFKYYNFFLSNISNLFQVEFTLSEITLPLALSFFSFQQIAYLADCYKTKTCEKNFFDYSLFVTFFPQLIMGPIVHHAEMLPQFKVAIPRDKILRDFSIGGGLFLIGLFKKLLIADQVAVFSDSVFAAAQSGVNLTFVEAWSGALAYTFQIYFDFSGYTDMAVGSARFFGIHLPINFNSPYKSTNPSDFWTRWHITLSRFLRDYLYFPLGGNRFGILRTLINLLITMLIGGLWHGANWTFVIWGAYHGLLLASYHLIKKLSAVFLIPEIPLFKVIRKYFSMFLTFTLVVMGWVLFRSDSIETALSILKSMTLKNGIYPGFLSNFVSHENIGVSFMNGIIGEPSSCIAWLLFLAVVVFMLPNSMQLAHFFEETISVKESKYVTPGSEPLAITGYPWLLFKGYVLYPMIGFVVLSVSLILYMASDSSPFIYTVF